MSMDVARSDFLRPASAVRLGPRRRARAVAALVPAALVLGTPAAPALAEQPPLDAATALGAYATALPAAVVDELTLPEASALAAARPVAGAPATRLAVSAVGGGALDITTIDVA